MTACVVRQTSDGAERVSLLPDARHPTICQAKTSSVVQCNERSCATSVPIFAEDRGPSTRRLARPRRKAPRRRRPFLQSAACFQKGALLRKHPTASRDPPTALGRGKRPHRLRGTVGGKPTVVSVRSERPLQQANWRDFSLRFSCGEAGNSGRVRVSPCAIQHHIASFPNVT